MPEYDYTCDACGLTQEFTHPIDKEPMVVCPSCYNPMRRKVGVGLAELWRGAFSERAVSKTSAKEHGTDDW